MKKHLRHWAAAAVAAAAALAFTSCAYDPYYSSVGGSYTTGYGEGYGYGGSHFSTSVFVATGDPQWGYDPYCYSYYDYHRRCYYDPYLNGYYPIGYRPPVIIGVPHPYGYRHGYCPPPRYVHHGTIPNYHNRENAYRNSNYGWARQVRQHPGYQSGAQDSHSGRNSSRNNSDAPFTRLNTDPYSSANRNTYTRPQAGSRSSSRQSQGRNAYSQDVRPAPRESQNGRPPSGYNTPVTRSSSRHDQSAPRNAYTRNQSRQSPPPNIQGDKRGGGNRAHQPAPRHSEKQERQEESRPSKEEKRGIRSLGQG